jgi:hypothetical protein
MNPQVVCSIYTIYELKQLADLSHCQNAEDMQMALEKIAKILDKGFDLKGIEDDIRILNSNPIIVQK